MGNTERVQVENGGRNLMGDALGPLFGDLEVLRLEIIEEISASKILHDDIDVITVFENVIESDNVRMLAYFENLNFPLQEFYVFQRQILFLDNFDSNLLLTLFMNASFHETVFTFSERLLNIVEVMEVGESNGLLDFADPLVSFFHGFEVVNSPLIGEDEHEWVEDSSVIEGLLHFTFDENTG